MEALLLLLATRWKRAEEQKKDCQREGGLTAHLRIRAVCVSSGHDRDAPHPQTKRAPSSLMVGHSIDLLIFLYSLRLHKPLCKTLAYAH